MRSDSICLWIAAALCTLVPHGCAKKTPEPAGNTTEQIDGGTFDGSMYRNKYLGLRVWIPPDWSIQDQQTQKEIMQKGVQITAGDNQNMRAALEASEAQSIQLFMAFKHPPGSPVAFNPVIAGTAERVAHLPGIRTGGDYLFHVRRLQEASQVKHSFPREVRAETIGGAEFYVMSTEIALSPQMVVTQEYYATVRKGYAVSLILLYAAEEDKIELYNILDAVVLAPPE